MAAGERRDFFTFKSKLHDVYMKHIVMIKGLLFLTPQRLYLGDTEFYQTDPSLNIK
ncbi:unnamed protein product [Acanthoscelides obtectus]|uniref:Uncharacterized protein n=1 Tax=Acanthoscelides obtectus TaxID=200917 RepID=A0A9P0LQW3_ACAOB|nr:unnamed protein product [Acanthoscelides obtectus]CAK1624261.1 hypothetical protein AOBTE_LOCUS2450 [Acanthoscelides obtectus]